MHRLGWGDYQQTMVLTANDPVLVSHHYEGGTLKLTADQAGTSVTLDGTLLGDAPVELPVSTGNHTIVATIGGKAVDTKQIAVVTGQASEVNLAALAPATTQQTLWTPGEGMTAATPTPTPAPTPKEEQAALFPTPTPRRPAAQRRLVTDEAAAEAIGGADANAQLRTTPAVVGGETSAGTSEIDAYESNH